MAEIVACPHCATRIIPTAAGACPACGRALADPPVPPPPPKPRRPPINRFLFVLCLVVIAIGLGRYWHRDQQQLERIVVDLVFIWGGCIGIIGLYARRYYG